MEITALRDQINQIDRSIVTLFAQRMSICAQIADYKKKHELPIYDPIREQEILSIISQQVEPEISDFVRELYVKLFALSREYQSK